MDAEKPAAYGLTRDEVRLGYQFILGREPESEAVILEKQQVHNNVAEFRAALFASEEYALHNGGRGHNFSAAVNEGYWADYGPVEYKISSSMADRLTARIKRQWAKLGEEEPYWSVLTDDGFKLKSMDNATLAKFHETGRYAASLIDISAKRSGRSVPRGVCLELGCGVGRVTRFLADRFSQVMAVDISPGNLAVCQNYMEKERVKNVRTHLIKKMSDFSRLPRVDFFYSIIVLQHNPPPLQYEMLSSILSKISPGGACLFQVVADMPGYSFDAEEYLKSDDPVMEIHSLPMAAVTDLIQRNGLKIDLIRMDPWLDVYGSYTFSAHRPA